MKGVDGEDCIAFYLVDFGFVRVLGLATLACLAREVGAGGCWEYCRSGQACVSPGYGNALTEERTRAREQIDERLDIQGRALVWIERFIGLGPSGS